MDVERIAKWVLAGAAGAVIATAAERIRDASANPGGARSWRLVAHRG